MKVEQLNLVNFRRFELIELKFEPGVNVVTGVNDVEKSGIFQHLHENKGHFHGFAL